MAMTEKASESSAEKPSPRKRKAKAVPQPRRPLWRVGLRWLGRGLGAVAGLYAALVLLFSFVP
ncbi:MAG TPA: hypothetical protein VK146_02500, partial [Tabrizicola sp.]|nr:hypothetical protein [Tabrizicola sp.]